MGLKKKLINKKLREFLEELRIKLRNIKVSKNNYIIDLSEAINILMTSMIIEKLLEDENNFNKNCYLLGFTPEKINNFVNNKKIINFDIETILRFSNYFNISFSEIKKLAIKNIMLNSNLIIIK